jgi:hypothetical protein
LSDVQTVPFTAEEQKAQDAVREQVTTARQSLDDIKLAKEYNKKAYPKIGRMFPETTYFATLGANSEGYEAFQKMTGLTNSLALAVLGGKLGAQISDEDRKFVEKTIANVQAGQVVTAAGLDRMEKIFEEKNRQGTKQYEDMRSGTSRKTVTPEAAARESQALGSGGAAKPKTYNPATDSFE